MSKLVPTDRPTATKAVRKAATAKRKAARSASDDRIAKLEGMLEALLKQSASPAVAASPAVVNQPIPAMLQALVNSGKLSQEEAQAMANDVSLCPVQTAAADSIPAITLQQRPAPVHTPPCIQSFTPDGSKHAINCISIPLDSKAATGFDKNDRLVLGVHKALAVVKYLDSIRDFAKLEATSFTQKQRQALAD